jgi:hypothetical protein
MSTKTKLNLDRIIDKTQREIERDLYPNPQETAWRDQ